MRSNEEEQNEEHGNHDFVPDHHQAIEPTNFASMNRFVAGTYKMDRKAGLNAPLNDTISRQSQPNKQSVRPGEIACDFSNSDSQYERYKNLMQNNFYSLNANTTAFNTEVRRTQVQASVTSPHNIP